MMHARIALILVALFITICTVYCKTSVTIDGTQFFINGKVTNAGSLAAGLILNSRMMQGIFDDENATTVGEWAYPDTHVWNATRNTLEFVTNMSVYSNKGLNAVTVGLQGGNPDSTGKNNKGCIATAFNASGHLKPAWVSRLQQVIKAADQQQLVVILTLFDLSQEERLGPDDNNIVTAVSGVVQELASLQATNVILNLADACSNQYTHQILTPSSIDTLIKLVQGVSKIPVSTSFPPGVIPPNDVIQSADYILLHTTGLNDTGLSNVIQTIRNLNVYKKSPLPIVINQDSAIVAGLVQSVEAQVSWGYYAQGSNDYKDGYSSPPINWAINTVDKRAFFTEVHDLTQAE